MQRERKGNSLFEYISLHSSDLGCSRGNRCSTLLQSEKGSGCQTAFEAHNPFSVTENFSRHRFLQHKGQKVYHVLVVRPSLTVPSQGSWSTQVQEFLLLQQPTVLVQKINEKAELGEYILITQRPFLSHRDSGIVALNDQARILVDSIHQE